MKKEQSDNLLRGKELERYFDFNYALYEFHQLFTYDEKDDRSIAIVGGTFLELALDHILRAFLPEEDKEVNKLFEFNNALGNFSNKITMVYSLGLIDKLIKDDLHLVRKIRNEFAHDLYASFENQKIAQLCKNLKWHKVAYVANPPENATIRDLFQVDVNQLISHLSGIIGISRGEKRKVIDNYKE